MVRQDYKGGVSRLSGQTCSASIVFRTVGEIVVLMFQVCAAIAAICLILGTLLKSRALLMLGGSLTASLVLTWVLGLLGLPVGIVFGVLGTGFFFRPPKGPDDPPPTEFREQ